MAFNAHDTVEHVFGHTIVLGPRVDPKRMSSTSSVFLGQTPSSVFQCLSTGRGFEDTTSWRDWMLVWTTHPAATFGPPLWPARADDDHTLCLSKIGSVAQPSAAAEAKAASTRAAAEAASKSRSETDTSSKN